MTIFNIKKRLKDLIMVLIYFSGMHLIINRLLSKDLYIVGYHRLAENTADDLVHVIAITEDNFKRHLGYYRKHFEIITMNEVEKVLEQKKLDKNYIVITFDDGYRDNYTIGKKIFEDEDISPTIYLTAAHIDERKIFWTDAVDSIIFMCDYPEIQLKILNLEGVYSLSSRKDKVYLAELIKDEIKLYDEKTKKNTIDYLVETFNVTTSFDDSLIIEWSEVKELIASGVLVGSHTMNHPTLSKIPLTNAIQEIEKSKELIEERIQQEVQHFAYPYGKESDYTPLVKRKLEKIYKTVITAIDGVNKPSQDIHDLKRIIIENISVYHLSFRLMKLKIKSRKIS